MASPVNLSDLPVATSADPNDLMLLRKGLTDYQAAVSVIQAINISILSPIPGGSAANTDIFLISRNAQNYNIRFSQVSFVIGTRIWFYNGAAPVGWSVVPSTGDRVLAVSGFFPNTTYANTSAGNQGGNWQQTGVTLSIQQIPNHQHWGHWGRTQSNEAAKYLYGAQSFPQGDNPVYGGNPDSGPILGIVGGQGDNSTHSNYGQCLAHNHGNTWRPAANVGLICNKNT